MNFIFDISGIAKRASMQKQALTNTTLIAAINKAIARGQHARAVRLIAQAQGRNTARQTAHFDFYRKNKNNKDFADFYSTWDKGERKNLSSEMKQIDQIRAALEHAYGKKLTKGLDRQIAATSKKHLNTARMSLKQDYDYARYVDQMRKLDPAFEPLPLEKRFPRPKPPKPKPGSPEATPTKPGTPEATPPRPGTEPTPPKPGSPEGTPPVPPAAPPVPPPAEPPRGAFENGAAFGRGLQDFFTLPFRAGWGAGSSIGRGVGGAFSGLFGLKGPAGAGTNLLGHIGGGVGALTGAGIAAAIPYGAYKIYQDGIDSVPGGRTARRAWNKFWDVDTTDDRDAALTPSVASVMAPKSKANRSDASRVQGGSDIDLTNLMLSNYDPFYPDSDMLTRTRVFQ